jgi:integrase
MNTNSTASVGIRFLDGVAVSFRRGFCILMTNPMTANALAIAADRTPASRNPALVYISHFLSDRSKRTMKDALRGILLLITDLPPDELPLDAETAFAWYELRYQHVQAIRFKLMNKYAPATVNRHLSALRGVLKECWRLGYMDVETYQRASDIQNIKYEVLPAGRDLPTKEMSQLIMGCYEDGNKGIRDLAIMALLYTSGMRRAELTQLDLASYDAESGTITVHGKGNKQRTVYAANRTKEVLDDWIQLRGDAAGALFTSIHKGGKVSNRRLPDSAIYAMIDRRATAAGLRKLRPHDFRRSFVSNMLDSGVDAVTITKLTGHASVDLLRRYDRRTERAKLDAVRKLDLPG